MTRGEGWMMTVADPAFRWGVDASRVERVIGRAEWSGAMPVDVAARLGGGVIRDEATRVMLFATETEALPLLARGEIALERVDGEARSPVPELLRRAGCSDALLGFVFRGPGEVTFLVAPELLTPPVTSEESHA
jgi:hypothetical protein